MGMFDYLYYKGKEYQTKDTPAQMCDKYKIETNHDDGHTYLWHEAYNAKWVEDKDSLFGSRIETWNHRWECCQDFDGVINFYERIDEEWVEYHSLFMNGQMIKLEKVE